MSKAIVGIDNGPTGSIGIIGPDGVIFESVPTKESLHYGKAGTKSKRLDRAAFKDLMFMHVPFGTMVFVERPFTGQFVKAAISAARFYEAMIICLEDMNMGYQTVDSKEWQKPVLGEVKGSAALKKASKLRGIEMYPNLKAAITKHKDADGLLIAHHFFYT